MQQVVKRYVNIYVTLIVRYVLHNRFLTLEHN
jgi:hypothetical protein